MNLRLFLVVFLFIAIGGVTGCDSFESADKGEWVPGDPIAGQSVYNNAGSPGQRCYDCHGADGSGAWPNPSIKNKSVSQIATAVRLGPSTMPAYSTSDISDQDLTDLIAFVKSL